MTQTDLYAIPPAIRQEVDTRLDTLVADTGVRLLLAVESGSRAWGFPSPDSDYDVRFIYVRPRRDYLALKSPRDVLEQPIVDDIDLNGWDIRKALGLMLRNNAVLAEWIAAPIRYRDPDPVMAQLSALIDRYFDPNGFAHHYARLGRGVITRWLEGGDDVAVKRYFYALRPALAVRVLRMQPWQRPPMALQQLMAQADLTPDVVAAVNRLVEIKATTREAGLIERAPALEALITDELSRANDVPRRAATPAYAADAEALFLKLVDG